MIRKPRCRRSLDAADTITRYDARRPPAARAARRAQQAHRPPAAGAARRTQQAHRTRAALALLPTLALLAGVAALAGIAATELGCRGLPAPTPRTAAASSQPAAHRVVLISLDGAAADDLHRLRQAGALTAGGFARFWQQGEVADRLIPVDPSLTATNHISLATGQAADRTGIVANFFHAPGTPFLDEASGFSTTIASETLWEAAHRQGKRVAILTWPGADDSGPRRRGDWGLTYTNGADRAPQLLTLDRAAWHPADNALTSGAAGTAGAASHSPLLAAHIEVGAGKPGAQRFDLLAVDRTDDGKTDYDGLLVLPAGGIPGAAGPANKPAVAGAASTSGPAAGASSVTGATGAASPAGNAAVTGAASSPGHTAGAAAVSGAAPATGVTAPGAPLAPGRWAEVPCQISGRDPAVAPRAAVCTVKLLELAPDLARTRLYFGGVYTLHAYPPPFGAALAAQGLYWPGPADDRSLRETWNGRPGIDLPTWIEQSDRFARFFADAILAAAARPDWDLLLGYLPVIDAAGHQLDLADPRQAGYSAERRDLYAAARRQVWQSVDRELARILAALDLGTTTVVVVSDHGMTPLYATVDPNVLLHREGLLAVDDKGEIAERGTQVYAVSSGPMVNLYLAPGHADLVPRLRELFRGWTVDGRRPVERVLTRAEAAAIHLDHPNSGDLILFLREGTVAGDLLASDKMSAPAYNLGGHGYLATHPDMHGIYLAAGAGVGRGGARTVHNPEVAGRVAAWLGIERPRPAAP